MLLQFSPDNRAEWRSVLGKKIELSKIPYFAREFLRLVNSISDELLKGAPTWSRPIFKLAFLALTIIAVPVMVIFRYQPKMEKSQGIEALDKYVRELWSLKKYEDSLQELRRCYEILLNEPEIKDKVSIEPYGTFVGLDVHDVRSQLYGFEEHFNNWDQADKLCDDALKDDNNYPDMVNGHWKARKAQCIEKLHGLSASKEYLMKNADPMNPYSHVNKHLETLKKSS